MTFKATLKLDGLEPLLAHLRELGTTKARSAMRRGLEVATTPVLQMARQLCPVDSAQLRKSLGRRVKTYRGSGTTVVIIGPRQGFKAEVTDRYGRRRVRDPIRYAHLVEQGHRIAVGGSLQRKGGKVLGKPAPRRPGKHTGSVPPHPFLVPALERNRDVVMNILRRHLEDVLIRSHGGG